MTRWIGHLLVLGVMPAGFVLLAQDPVTVDPRHYTVEIDNRKVRTLRVHYEPGEGSPMHEHSAGVRVFLTDIHNRFIAPDGSTSESSRVAGEIIWAEPVRHSNTNLGKNRVEIIELELKGLPAHPASRTTSGPVPDASQTVVIDNEFARVLRMKLAGHQATSAYRNPDQVVVAMNEQHFGVTDDAAGRQEHTWHRGQVSWVSAGVHRIENLGDTPMETILIEFKER